MTLTRNPTLLVTVMTLLLSMLTPLVMCPAMMTPLMMILMMKMADDNGDEASRHMFLPPPNMDPTEPDDNPGPAPAPALESPGAAP
eukprot:scaffold2665_cov106-Cylindrotheca_fusiformis.AAC.1